MNRMIVLILCLALISLACLQTSGPYWTPGPEMPASTATILISESPEPTLTKVPTAPPAPQICAVVVAIEALHVRSDADENSQVFDYLERGDIVLVLDQWNADWWFIEYAGLSGYARSIYLKESECD